MGGPCTRSLWLGESSRGRLLRGLFPHLPGRFGRQGEPFYEVTKTILAYDLSVHGQHRRHDLASASFLSAV